MLKTKDGYEITIGMWVSDDTGIYEVTDIYNNNSTVELREVELYNDGTFTITGNLRWLTSLEAKKLNYN